MNALDWIQDPGLRESLGWTMVHFLWLGSIAWLIAAAGKRALRCVSPGVRYGYSVACLIGLTLLPLVILGALRMDQAPPSSAASAAASPAPSIATFPTTPTTSQPPPPVNTGQAASSSVNSIGTRIIRALPFGWLGGFAIYTGLLLAGAVGIERLRRDANVEADSDLLELVSELKSRLAIAGNVLVGFSDQVISPFLIGLSRPMILLPASALTGVPRDQLEMILLHELAHVRRRDNWVNLAQRLIEAALFFHPAIWAVSHWIRVEREFCCDDEVIRHSTHEPVDYARALADFAIHSPHTGQVLASAMAQKPLLARIRHILNQEDQPMKTTHRTLIPALACFAALGILSYSATLALADAKPGAARAGDPALPSGDTILAKVQETYTTLKTYQATGSTEMEISAGTVPENATEIEKATAQKSSFVSDFSLLTERSGKFRLEWEQKVQPTFSNGGIAWSDGAKHAYLPSFATEPQIFDSAAMVLGAVHGVSSMLPETVQLFQGNPCQLAPLTESKIRGEELLHGNACWVITGKSVSKQEVTLWVSKDDHLIRRIKLSVTLGTPELQRIDQLSPDAKKAMEMAKNRTITWETNLREITTDELIAPSSFGATAKN